MTAAALAAWLEGEMGRTEEWMTDPAAALLVTPTGYAMARCFYHGHDLHEDGRDRRVCVRCGLAWIRAALAGGEP